MAEISDVAGSPDAGHSQILETKFGELSISECPVSPSPYSKMPEIGAQGSYVSPVVTTNPVELDNICLKEVVVENCVSPQARETMAEEVTDAEIPHDTQAQDEPEFACPPILYRSKNKNGEEDEFCFLTSYHRKPKKGVASKADYDSDDTCDNFVQCGENGLCKCRKMQGRQYYEYYLQTKNTEDYTMYPKGRCTLPKGTILHFTIGPNNLRREDISKALIALGAKIEFIDFQSGNQEGWVRLSYPYEARVVIKKMTDKKLNIAEVDLIFRVLSGKEEKRYLQKVIEDIFKLHQKAKSLNKKLKKSGYKYVTKFNN